MGAAVVGADVVGSAVVGAEVDETAVEVSLVVGSGVVCAELDGAEVVSPFTEEALSDALVLESEADSFSDSFDGSRDVPLSGSSSDAASVSSEDSSFVVSVPEDYTRDFVR